MKKIIYLFIAVAIMYSCKKNDEALSVRKLIFKEDADSVVVALKNYDFFTASTTISFFNEDFLNNNSGWPIINPTGGVSPNLNDVKVVNGEYKIFCDVNPLVLSISKAIDTSKNFEVECKVRNEDRIGSTSSFPSQGFFFCSNVTDRKSVV